MALRQKAVVFLLIAIMMVALSGVNYWGTIIRRQAVENWLEKANGDAQRITVTALNGLSLFHTQLRGAAAPFYGSQKVGKDEFIDAIDLIEGVDVEAMVPPTVLAYVEQRAAIEPSPETKTGSHFPVTLSSDISGLLEIGTDLAGHHQIYSAFHFALRKKWFRDQFLRGRTTGYSQLSA
jgi:hypothetical protein